MVRMGWSWPELLALPADYRDVLVEMLNEHDREQELARRHR